MRSSTTPPGLVITATGFPRSVTIILSPALALRRYSPSRFLISLISTIIIGDPAVAQIANGSFYQDTARGAILRHGPDSDQVAILNRSHVVHIQTNKRALVLPETVTNSTSEPSGSYTCTMAPRSPLRRPCSGRSRSSTTVSRSYTSWSFPRGMPTS